MIPNRGESSVAGSINFVMCNIMESVVFGDTEQTESVLQYDCNKIGSRMTSNMRIIAMIASIIGIPMIAFSNESSCHRSSII